MFDKIKSWLLGIGGAIIGFLALLAGARKKKIEKLKKENAVKDSTIKGNAIAQDMEQEHNEKLLQKSKESAETIEEVRKNEKSYNDIIDAWNNPS